MVRLSESSNYRNVLIFKYLVFQQVELFPRLFPQFAFDTRLLLLWFYQ